MFVVKKQKTNAKQKQNKQQARKNCFERKFVVKTINPFVFFLKEIWNWNLTNKIQNSPRYAS